jgi:GDPmannose 4,6-dehydratase
MKTAVITGVTGQDGSYLAELLLSKGYHVVGVKRRTSLLCTDRIDRFYDHANFKMVYGNLHDGTSAYRILSDHKPDEIYNIAAQSHVRVSFDVPEETVDSIALGTLRLLEACRLLTPDARFYQASSSEMFGDNPTIPQNELTRMTPASPYACAKLFAHNLVRNYRLGYGMHVSSGILFNHESPRRGETFVTRKITRAAARIKLGLQDDLYLGNLDAKRDWGFAGDYVEAMWLMLQQEKPDDYVVATGVTHTVREFLEMVFRHAELSVEDHVKFDSRFLRPHEVPILLGDPTKARETLGWQSSMDLETLSRMMFESDLEEAKMEMLLVCKKGESVV